MKLIELVNARTALGKLIVQDLPIRTAYDLMLLTDVCNKHLEFYGNEIAKFDPEANAERLSELNDMEVEITQDKIIINLDGNLRLSAVDVKMLSPLIEFEVIE